MRITSTHKSLNKITLIKLLSCLTVITLAGCGGDKVEQPATRGPTSDQTEGPNSVEKDPTTMSLAELRLYLSELNSRNTVELDEYYFLQAMNKELCDRLQRIRNECVVAAPLYGAQKILGCDGEFEENTSITHKFYAKIGSNITSNFRIIAENNIISDTFSAGTNEITFAKEGNEQVESPALKDIVNLKLESIGSLLPSEFDIGFSFSIDETLLFTSDHLIKDGEGDDAFYRFNFTKITDILNSEACRMSDSEFEVIEQSIRSRASGTE